jgi:putative ABC transport system permease protein
MNLLRSLQTAFANLRANKLRSALTMLGIIIGVSAVIVMVSLVEGARAMVVGEFERLGSKLIIVAYQLTPEQERKTTRRLPGLTMDDVRAIRRECLLIQDVSAEMPTGAATKAAYADRESTTSAIGVQPSYLWLRNRQLDRGRFLSEEDERNWAKVCVIGSRVRADLFPGEDPLGKTIEVLGSTLTVVGTLAKKGKAAGQDEDAVILAPITTIQKRMAGIEIVGVIFAQPRDNSQVEPAMQEIWECLMRRHQNAPGFKVDSQENILKAIGRVLSIFGLVLGGIAGLALIVGGIGVMNIMLVSVTERTREIGIRKAVGARRRDILWQFLIEAATLTAVGGSGGILIGAGVAKLIGVVSRELMPADVNNGMGIPTFLPLWAILGAFAFSATIGLFFGIYPAVRASRLEPVAALRYE